MTNPASAPLTSPDTDRDAETIAQARALGERLRGELAKAVVGQQAVVEHLLISLLAGGHALLVGVPGLAKTLLVSSLAKALDLRFRRIQFTPDLMPADITGIDLIEDDPQGRRQFVFRPGPLFANLILADEINRAPPKTQSALLEAMQEHSVTVAGQTHALGAPFFVLATQNPLEQEGTYPLPEAQLDRFMCCLQVGYPSHDEGVRILEGTTGASGEAIAPVVDGAALVAMQAALRRIPAARPVLEYAVTLVEKTRPGKSASAKINKYVRWGAGPRASQHLVLAGKVRAALHGRFHLEREDLDALLVPVLRHRLLLTYHAEADGVTAEDLLAGLR